ncbi:F0F1 ATP synthase subunit epsilon [Rhodobacteraceae bacterium XHP0102]|nr:F0F1 ATP synthase subunit epsilon [Rhodobacteraceae bacterium XHP0102]
MAEAFKFDLVSPERRLASLDATEVQIPAAGGDLTAMANHAPTITTLRPGLLQVTHSGGQDDYIVLGGFVEISGEKVTVLAERALPRAEVTKALHAEMVEEYRQAHEAAKANAAVDPTLVDDAAKRLSDMEALGDHITA